jgi:hypothetical protein
MIGSRSTDVIHNHIDIIIGKNIPSPFATHFVLLSCKLDVCVACDTVSRSAISRLESFPKFGVIFFRK